MLNAIGSLETSIECDSVLKVSEDWGENGERLLDY
jgi:hypothetical protein